MNWRRKFAKNWGQWGMKCNIWDYEKRALPDILSFIVDNRGKTVPTTNSGHILIATNCVRNENLFPSYDKVRFLSEETYQHWFRAHPMPGDILFVCKGTPGRVCMVPDPVDFCIAQDMVALRVNDDIVYNKYLLAVLRSARIQKQIEQTSVGDVIPHFKKSFFDQLLIPIPPFEIQRVIGDYYFAFSEKIELNKKINNHLAPHLCEAQIAAAKRRGQIPQPDGCLHTDGKVSARGANEENAEQFSSLQAA